MKFNEFGKTGMIVSEIGFGGSRIGGFFADKHSGKEALDVLRKALDSGITFYDTADMYAQGESESLIGTAFRGRREQVILATKGGYCLPAQRNLMKRIKPLVRPIVQALGLKRAKLPAGMSGTLSQDFSPSYLTKALESSLKRLQTDYVDLYQLHSPGAPFLQSDAFGDALQTPREAQGAGKAPLLRRCDRSTRGCAILFIGARHFLGAAWLRTARPRSSRSGHIGERRGAWPRNYRARMLWRRSVERRPR